MISKQNLNTLDDVNNFINTSSDQIKLIEKQRQRIYNKLRRCTDTTKEQIYYLKEATAHLL